MKPEKTNILSKENWKNKGKVTGVKKKKSPAEEKASQEKAGKEKPGKEKGKEKK